MNPPPSPHGPLTRPRIQQVPLEDYLNDRGTVRAESVGMEHAGRLDHSAQRRGGFLPVRCSLDQPAAIDERERPRLVGMGSHRLVWPVTICPHGHPLKGDFHCRHGRIYAARGGRVSPAVMAGPPAPADRDKALPEGFITGDDLYSYPTRGAGSPSGAAMGRRFRRDPICRAPSRALALPAP